MAHIDELLIAEELIRYANRQAANSLALAQFFPEQKKATLDIKMFKGAYNAPVSAEVHSFDTETQLADYDGYSFDWATMLLVKRQYHIGEELLIRLSQTNSDAVKQEIKNEIYDHVNTLVNSIKVRFERMRAEAMQTGKIKIDENGVKATIDYHMPTKHLVTGDWSTEDADPLSDIRKWCDTVEETSGIRPSRILTRRTKLNELLSNSKVRKQVLGIDSSESPASQAEYNAYAQKKELPVIGVYEGSYRQQTPSGKKIEKKYIDDKSFILLPGDTLGNTFYGPTAEEIELRKDPSIEIGARDYITLETYRKPDSPAKFIKAVATGLITFPYVDEVLCATIE